MDFIIEQCNLDSVSMLTNVNVNAASNINFCSEISVTNSQIKSSFKEMKCSHNKFQMSLRKVCKRGVKNRKKKFWQHSSNALLLYHH